MKTAYQVIVLVCAERDFGQFCSALKYRELPGQFGVSATGLPKCTFIVCNDVDVALSELVLGKRQMLVICSLSDMLSPLGSMLSIDATAKAVNPRVKVMTTRIATPGILYINRGSSMESTCANIVAEVDVFLSAGALVAR